jgi:hypothetical protein
MYQNIQLITNFWLFLILWKTKFDWVLNGLFLYPNNFSYSPFTVELIESIKSNTKKEQDFDQEKDQKALFWFLL